MAVDALDKYYLALTVLVTIGYQLLGFAIAWTFQFDKITDFTGGSNFFLLAILTLCVNGIYHARNIVATVFVLVWATRLAGFLLFRVLKTGSDTRFDDIRSHFFKFLGFWVGQILWVWTVSLPLTILNSPGVTSAGAQPNFGTGTDIAGVVLWAVGWIIESAADIQKVWQIAFGLINLIATSWTSLNINKPILQKISPRQLDYGNTPGTHLISESE
ncbi:hypothetical protein BN14_04459 [Rhizoctonia solani AG-1 IB]|uniref:Transmembrane protein n=1 Tax=Thanatephorus cucumeris (strain AG1-IB / isolate 7/3/14) TaxID=1108050 RepID=M5BV64_THACB|nr:hypothetical protein BN14_04459 [Rhizoctonia solani AG-1 IB]